MNRKFLSALLLVLATALVSCHKDDIDLSGKWRETKLTMYETDGTGAHLYDTTYTQPFTNEDFAEFVGSKTFIVSEDHYFYLNIPGQNNAIQQIAPQTAQWNYTAISDRVFVLNSQGSLTNPGGFIVADTVTIVNPHLLWLHSVGYGHQIGPQTTVGDSYYTKD